MKKKSRIIALSIVLSILLAEIIFLFWMGFGPIIVALILTVSLGIMCPVGCAMLTSGIIITPLSEEMGRKTKRIVMNLILVLFCVAFFFLVKGAYYQPSTTDFVTKYISWGMSQIYFWVIATIYVAGAIIGIIFANKFKGFHVFFN